MPLPSCYRANEEERKLQVGVLYFNSYEPVERKHEEHIRSTIFEKKNNWIKKYPGSNLLIEDTTFVNGGWFIITCQNEETVQWCLMLDIPDKDGRAFAAVHGPYLPRSVKLEINLEDTSLDADYVLQALEHQNPGLKTFLWDVIGVIVTEQKKINLEAPPTVVPTLKDLNWKPYFELSRIEITREK